jgi:Glycosyl transferase family 11
MSVGPYITARGSEHLSDHNTGLGNVLFQIASSYGISNKTGRQLSFVFVAEYCRILKERFGFNHGETILKKCLVGGGEAHTDILIVHEPGGSHHKYVEQLVTAIMHGPAGKMLCIWGYMESRKYFAEHMDQIRAMFAPDEATISNILRQHSILVTCPETVSIHFRWHEYTYLYDQAYYKVAIAYMKALCAGKSVHFLVFSDDVSKVPFDELGLVSDEYTIVKNAYDYLDLWTMSCCKHHIVSKSTFSYWGWELRSRDRSGCLVCPTATDKFSVDWYPDTAIRM